MNKMLIGVLIICLVVVGGFSIAEPVVQLPVQISFSDVTREGLFTGEVNENGVPDGYGVFESINSAGTKYICVGYWDNGKMNGNGWAIWEDGLAFIGVFDNNEFIQEGFSKEVKPSAGRTADQTGIQRDLL